MEEIKDLSLTKFTISFNDQLLKIDFDSSFNEYKTQTINNVIQEVLDKLGQKPQIKKPDDYILVCSCGRPFNSNKLLSKAKCPHYFEEDFDENKNKNEKFILYEKEQEEKYEKYLSDF